MVTLIMGPVNSESFVDANSSEFASVAYQRLLEDVRSLPDLHLDGQEVQRLEKDLEYLVRRCKNEGAPFFTERLPEFAKACERSLEEGSGRLTSLGLYWQPTMEYPTPNGPVFLPRFLSVLTERILVDDNLVPLRLEEIAGSALRAIRQICYVFYKFPLAADPSKDQAVIDNFVKTEQYLQRRNPIDTNDQFDLAVTLCRKVLSSCDFRDIVPKHGPGAVAGGQKGRGKWILDTKYLSIHQTYPYYDYYPSFMRSVTPILAGSSCVDVGLSSPVDAVSFKRRLKTLEFPVAKVTLVPKDSRGPRLISMEPLELQFLQQGLMTNLVRAIESHPLTTGRVNFADQTVNGRLAMENSKSRKFATLDLKDASDRVSCSLVEALTGDYWRYFKALRSNATILPSQTVMVLEKYAPMGSSLCFPVLALCVWSIAASAAIKRGFASSDVYVYGDDLVIPSDCVDVVIQALTDADLAVNVGKSFWKGFFRESCGVDAFAGVNVTPLRIKKIPPKTSSSVQELVAWIAYADQFAEMGFPSTASWCRSVVERVTGVLPRLPFKCGALSFHGDLEIPRGSVSQLDYRSGKVWLTNCLTVETRDLKDPFPDGASLLYWCLTTRAPESRDLERLSTGVPFV